MNKGTIGHYAVRGMFHNVPHGLQRLLDLTIGRACRLWYQFRRGTTDSHVITFNFSEIGSTKRCLAGCPKPMVDADVVTLANVNYGRSPFSELNGAIGEARGWHQTLDSGQIGVSGPGKASLPGADFITYDPSIRSLIVWDAKYRAEGGRYPSSVPASKLQAWQTEIVNSVKNMPEGPHKTAAENALKAGRVEGKIFKWPQ